MGKIEPLAPSKRVRIVLCSAVVATAAIVRRQVAERRLVVRQAGAERRLVVGQGRSEGRLELALPRERAPLDGGARLPEPG